MSRALVAALLLLPLTSTLTLAQDGPIRRFGQNIRNRVDAEMTREQIAAQERDVLNRVTSRIEWDKMFVGSSMQVTSQPGGTVKLSGSVNDVEAKTRAVDLAQSTLGVTTVIDELAVLKDVKVIDAAPAPRVIEAKPSRAIEVPATSRVLTVPASAADTKVIIKN